MTRYLFLLALLTIGFNGQSQEEPDPKTEEFIRVIQEREQKSAEKKYNYLGKTVSVIKFEVSGDPEAEPTPWASLEDPENDIPNLIGKDKVVIKQTSIRIIIDYPLLHEHEFTLTSETGFTRAELLRAISKEYYRIFEEEEATATIKTIPPSERTTLANRNETNGKYGIWGHDIGDLVLSTIFVYKAANGDIILAMTIES
jgi:hypothetical protein